MVRKRRVCGGSSDGLDVADVGAALEEHRGQRVPEDVAAALRREAGGDDVEGGIWGGLHRHTGRLSAEVSIASALARPWRLNDLSRLVSTIPAQVPRFTSVHRNRVVQTEVSALTLLAHVSPGRPRLDDLASSAFARDFGAPLSTRRR